MVQKGDAATSLTPVLKGSNAVGAVFDSATAQRVRDILVEGTPPNTRRAYDADLRYFWAWAAAIGFSDEAVYPIPEDLIVRFIVDHLEGLPDEIDRWLVDGGFKGRLGPHSMKTVERRVSTLATTHRAKGMDNPCAGPMVTQVLAKSKKAMARRGHKPRKKTAVVRGILDKMIESCAGSDLIAVRDKAVMLFAWSSGGRRRSEVATATMENLEAVGDDFVYTLGVTKSDQIGEGRTVPVTGRAAAALREWLTKANITEGPIFRAVNRHGQISEHGICDRTVARIVKNRARVSGLNPAMYAGHSLRSGFITEAGRQGKNLFDVMALSGHKTVQVAMGYHQAGAALRNEAARLGD